MNIIVNEHSRVCSAHFEGSKKQGKDAVPKIFTWTKGASTARASPKEHSTPVPVATSQSIGMTTFIPSENHVSTSTKDLIICTTVDKEIMVKAAIVSARYNTDIRTYCYVGTNTERVVSQTSEASTQSKLQTVSCVDVSKMTEGDYIKNITPFCIEQIKDDSKMIKFYIGVPSFQLLMVCFQFMSSAASNLSYGDYTKVTKRKLHKLSLFNEFFLMLCCLHLGLLEQHLAY